MKPLFGVWGGLTWCALTPFVAQAQIPDPVPDAGDAVAAVKFLDAVSVTATREKTLLQETPASAASPIPNKS
jgi:hypothetical protein